MVHYLHQVSDAVPVGHHAVLVLDRAGWHTTNKLLPFANVSLLPLPAGPPERNPAEQVGQQLRDCFPAQRPAIRRVNHRLEPNDDLARMP